MLAGADWDERVRGLNGRLGLTERDEFGLPGPGLPPPLFVGDVESLQPREWVMVISLNQARREEEEAWHLAQRYTSQSYWDHWRFLNRNWWNPRFYRPLVRLASTALSAPIDRSMEANFATTRMVFVELCPYSSRQFQLDHIALERVATDDLGFQVARQARQILIELAQPALVLVNGTAALANFESLEGDSVTLDERQYPSVGRPVHTLWHKEGVYRSAGDPVPVVGFPFLRKPSTHNSYAEIDQLAGMARALLGVPH